MKKLFTGFLQSNEDNMQKKYPCLSGQFLQPDTAKTLKACKAGIRVNEEESFLTTAG